MRLKIFLLIFLIVIFGNFIFAQRLDTQEKRDIFNKFILFLQKKIYFENKIYQLRLNITSPYLNSNFRQGDNIYISWNTNFYDILTNQDLNDEEMALGYYWKVDLYKYQGYEKNFVKELCIIPFSSYGNQSCYFFIPWNFEVGNQYFARVSLISSFNNKVLIFGDSNYFNISFLKPEEKNFKTFQGFLIKFNNKIYGEYDYFLITNKTIYLVSSPYYDINKFLNKFVLINGSEEYSKYNLNGIIVYSINLVD